MKKTKNQKELDLHYQFINNFVYDYCNDDKDREEFFMHLEALINCEIEEKKGCNQ